MYSEHEGSNRQLPAKKGDTSSLYARSRPRATVTASDASIAGREGPIAPGEEAAIVGFKAGERSIEHFPAGHDDNVEPFSDLIAPEHLAREPLEAIANDRAAELP
jgi:hypothetical protein